jgi:hypothetical protein
MINLLLQLLDIIEFELFVAPDGLHLVDHQCANLGGIEQEVFATLDEVIERLSTYWEDYIVRGIEDVFDYCGDTWEDLYAYGMANGGDEVCPSLEYLRLLIGGTEHYYDYKT